MRYYKIVTNYILLIILVFGSSEVYAQTEPQKNIETPTLNNNEFERFSSAAQSYFLQQKKFKAEIKKGRESPSQTEDKNVLVNDITRIGINQQEPSIGVMRLENDEKVILSNFNTSEGIYSKSTLGSFTGMAYSFDGGITFQDQGKLPGAENTPQMFFGDPGVKSDGKRFRVSSLLWPRLDAQSGFYAISLSTGEVNTELKKIVFGQPKVTVFSRDFLDKPYLTIDTKTEQTTIYVSYTRFPELMSNGQIELVKSEDGGETWSKPVIVHSEEEDKINQGSYPAVAPNGTLHVTWQRDWHGPNPEIWISKSSDHGKTFEPTKFVAKINKISNRPPVGYSRGSINEFPSITITPQGTILISFIGGNVSGDPDIYVARSTDTGKTWNIAEKPINDDASGKYQFFPWISADQENNVVVAVWYDRRSATTTLPAITDVYAAFSFDDGVTFGQNKRITDVSSDWLKTKSEERFLNFGDYINAEVLDGIAFIVWADGRLGTPDIFLDRKDPNEQ